MIHDLDIYRSAQILIREHGEDAAVEAARSVLITQIKLDLELSALGGGVVELDRHAIGILDEDLVKPQIRHLAVTDGYGLLLQACNHFFEPSSLESYVIDRAGARVPGIAVLFRQVHNGLIVEIKPVAGNFERRALPNPQPQNVHIEVTCRLEVTRKDEEVVQVLQRHAPLPSVSIGLRLI